MNDYAKELIQYSALCVICINMGYGIFEYWQSDRAEKQRLIERLKNLNDELRHNK